MGLALEFDSYGNEREKNPSTQSRSSAKTVVNGDHFGNHCHTNELLLLKTGQVPDVLS